MSRITRREMKRDDLLATIASVSSAMGHHTRSILIAVVALVVLAGAVVGGLIYTRSRAQGATEALGAVHAAAAAASYAGDSADRYRDVITRADEVIDAYPSSTASHWAAHWKAHSQAQLKEYDAALTTLEPLLAPVASTDGAALHQAARLMKARILEARGDLQGAADELGGMIAEAVPDFPLEIPLMERARLLEQMGKEQEAREIYMRIGREFPQSPYASQAMAKIGIGARRSG